MANVEITKKDGSPSPYYWSEDDGTEPRRKVVYRKTNEGIRRMRGVHYDAVAGRLRKD